VKRDKATARLEMVQAMVESRHQHNFKLNEKSKEEHPTAMERHEVSSVSESSHTSVMTIMDEDL
jgi:hypothetical protein